MQIFITGVAGFIGSHLAETLLEKGYDVVGVDNFNTFYDPALKRQNLQSIQNTAERTGRFFQCYSGDICDDSMMATLFANHPVKAVIHLAAMAGVRPSLENPVLYERVNGLGTQILLEEARKAGVKSIVFASSSSVYGLNSKVPFSEDDPVNLPYSPYAATKRAGELMSHVYHRVYGMRFACLRFFTVYGPRQRPDLAIRKFTDLLYQNKPLVVLGDGSARRDFTWIGDIIQGVVQSLEWFLKPESTYEIFNLGESQTTSVLELIQLIEEATHKKAEIIFKPPQPGDVPITYADLTKSRKVLGYHPQTPLKEGIAKFVEWYRKK